MAVRVVFSLVVVAVLAGCGSGSAVENATKNPTLVGQIVFGGNVPSSLQRGGRQAGLVEVFKTNRGVVAQERLARGERFAFRLPPGRYDPEAVISPTGGHCIYGGSRDGTVLVRRGQMTHADLYCVWHG